MASRNNLTPDLPIRTLYVRGPKVVGLTEDRLALSLDLPEGGTLTAALTRAQAHTLATTILATLRDEGAR